MRLQTKLILIICSLLFLVISLLWAVFQYMLVNALEEQTGIRALAVAEAFAAMPEVSKAFSDPDPSKAIQPIAETVRVKTGAEYIVVGNREGIRYSHPLTDRIGKEMVGGDNGPVLEGQSIVSEAMGSLGLSLRGKAPIRGDNGEVIGIVSVGYLMDEIEKRDDDYQLEVMLISLVALIIGSSGAIMISRGVRRSIHGLEPEQIGMLYMEKQAILESIREGILSINSKGFITMANKQTLRMLGLPEDTDITGRLIDEVVPTTRLHEVIQTGESQFDHEMIFGEHEVIANRVPIMDEHQQVIGAVSSFRSKSELYRLAEELSQVTRFAEGLRAQTHEYSNKLYVISGLIQLESYQEAIEMITRESDVHQNLIQFIMREIPDPVIGGLLIGKYNRAQELKLVLEIDNESTFRDVPATIDRDMLVTIIGNLIDNAMEAVIECERAVEKKVKLFVTDAGNDLIIECEDSGCGISDEVATRIYEKGYSSKQGERRGIGLALVRHAVDKLGGYITHQPSEQGGTVFTVVLPKMSKDREEES
ncbi:MULTISPECIES: ATP-binding protein [unclassified Paenibacillus]|uniref:ATP-binding protein n=1 Tax=unclassified Paenibacillus TaxID=185978 RepID=UPI00362A591B